MGPRLTPSSGRTLLSRAGGSSRERSGASEVFEHQLGVGGAYGRMAGDVVQDQRTQGVLPS